MLIGELADIAGVTCQTVRFYERRGLLPDAERGANGYRVYDEAMLARLRFINVAQAALGDEIVVPTLEDEHPLNIPAGTQTGTIFRLKGEGVPRVHGNGRGDELVIVNVAVPTALTAEQKRLFSELGASLGKEVSPQEDKSFLDRVRDALGF